MCSWILWCRHDRELQIVWSHVLKDTVIWRSTGFQKVLLLVNEIRLLVIHPFLLVDFSRLLLDIIDFLLYKMISLSFLPLDNLLSLWRQIPCILSLWLLQAYALEPISFLLKPLIFLLQLLLLESFSLLQLELLLLLSCKNVILH